MGGRRGTRPVIASEGCLEPVGVLQVTRPAHRQVAFCKSDLCILLLFGVEALSLAHLHLSRPSARPVWKESLSASPDFPPELPAPSRPPVPGEHEGFLHKTCSLCSGDRGPHYGVATSGVSWPPALGRAFLPGLGSCLRQHKVVAFGIGFTWGLNSLTVCPGASSSTSLSLICR